MDRPFHISHESFEHFHQKLLMQALSWYHVYDNTNVKKMEDFAKIYDVARTAAGLTNWRQGLEDCLNNVSGSLYSCRAGLEGAGLIVRVVVRCQHDNTKLDIRDCLTPFGSQVRGLIAHWEECAADEKAGTIVFPDSTRGERVEAK